MDESLPITASRPRRKAKRSADVSLMWPGRTWRLDEASREELDPVPLSRIERVGLSPIHRLIHGDNLEVIRSLDVAGKVDLVYVDPPYASDRDYVAEARIDGPADGRALRTLAYEDRWSPRGGVGAYLDMMAPRLDALAGLLSARGSIWVHVDWRASYLVRALLDEILGRDAFLNEIVWRRAPNLGRQATSGQFGRTLDTLVVYGRAAAKLLPPTRLEPIEPRAIRHDDEGRPFTSAPRGDYTDASIEKLDAEGRVHRTASGKVYIKYFLVPNEEGVLCRERRVDALWTDIAPLRHAPPAERTGYPTQKPRVLLERIVACATEPGGLVVDAFAGSGTTAIAAQALGRRAILVDASPVAITTARTRLLRENASFVVESTPSLSAPALAGIEAARTEQGIRLVTPDEPLAWAVGRSEDGTFETLWHAERTPGTKAKGAVLDAPVTGDDLSVRVFADDGSVGTVKA